MQWTPCTQLDRTLVTFGVSVGERLLLAVDSADILHVAVMDATIRDLMMIPMFAGERRSGYKN